MKKKISFLTAFTLLFVALAVVYTWSEVKIALGCGLSTNGQLVSVAADGSTTSCIDPPIISNSTSPSQTITGEVNTSLDKAGDPGNYCAKFHLGISGHHDIVILEKNEIATPDEDLTKCQEVAKSLETAYANGTTTVNAISGIVQPFRESYYYVRNYPEQVTVPDKNFTFFHDQNTDNNWKYDKNYYDYFYNDYPNNAGGVSAIQSFCRVHLEEGTNKLLSYEIRYRPTGDRTQNISKCATVPLTYSCNHKDVFNYSLKYEISQNGTFQPISATEAHKCEDMQVSITPTSEWFQTLNKTTDNATAVNNVVPLSHDMFVSPPANVLACSDQTSCLNAATEQTISDGVTGKGVHRIPDDFAGSVRNSIRNAIETNETNSESPYTKCANGKCVAYASGQRTLASSIPYASYFGQCKNQEIEINPPGVSIPSATSKALFDVVNRPPTTSVSFASATIPPGQSVRVTCDAVDPDSCVDKISKIKWSCFNSQGQQTGCYFSAPDGSWRAGNLTEEIATASMTNPYRATVDFKGTSEEAYGVTCEAFDNDVNTGGGSGSGSGGSSGYSIGGLKVCTNCGVVPDRMDFCAILTDQGSSKTVCGASAKINMQAYVASTLKADQYKWTCGNNDTAQVTTSDKQECNYASSGSYTPTLSIHDSESGKWVSCVSQAKAKIAGDNASTCSVGVREAGTTNEFATNLSVTKGTEVEAKVTRECLGKTDTTWTPTNGTMTSENKDNDTAKFKFPTAGIGSVSASIGTTNCGKANLTVNEEVNIR